LRGYLGRPGWLTAAWVGCLLGLAVLSKFTFLVLYPIVVLTWAFAWCRPGGSAESPGPVRWRHLILALSVSVLALNTGYAYRGTGRPLGSFNFRCQALRDFAGAPWVHGTWVERLPVPVPEEFIRGLDQQKDRAEHGAPGYLNQHWRQGGWWYFYVYALALKVPLGTWALGGLALACALVSRRSRARALDEWLLWAPSLAVVVLLSTQMRDQFAAVRYVLPALPLLFIAVSRVGLLVGDAWAMLRRASACARPLPVFSAAGFVVAALVWNGVSVVRVHPHYMAYLHELAGGPDRGWRHLIDANSDWGQDLLFVKHWLEDHPDARPLGLAYYGGMDPHIAGLDYQLPPSGLAPDFAGPPAGWYAVSASFVAGAPFAAYDAGGHFVGTAADQFGYFRGFKPAATAGYSILIYRVVQGPPGQPLRPFGPEPGQRRR
jgi:hypothetical protein